MARRRNQAEGRGRSGRVRVPDAESGSVLAEFALIAPLLVMVLFGIIEFGIAFNRAQAVEAAAREGGRLASLSNTTTSDISNRVNSALSGIPLQNPASVTVTPSGFFRPCEDRQGQPVTVEVETDHVITIPLLFSQTVSLEGEAIFRCEA